MDNGHDSALEKKKKKKKIKIGMNLSIKTRLISRVQVSAWIRLHYPRTVFDTRRELCIRFGRR
jgi:hypothetical protein